MRMEVGVMALLAFLCLVQMAGTAAADATTPPVLSEAIPFNNSYVPGGDRPFYVGVSASDLDAGTAKLYIHAVDQASWNIHAMVCNAISATDWNCSVTVPFNIVGSDTKELFYFTAADTFANTGTLGNSTHPMSFIVDTNKPTIFFINPPNNTYSAGKYYMHKDTETITLQVSDASSGVDKGTVFYSFDNSSWTQMDTTDNQTYTASWNTAGLENNQTVIIYAKASDKIGNTAYSFDNTSVDNELPRAGVNIPSEGQRLTGVVRFEITADDEYSGVNTSAATYAIGGYQRTLTCTAGAANYTCDGYFDTTVLSDGSYTVAFNVSDNAGNSVVASRGVTTYNKETYVSISAPSSGSYLRGSIVVNASVANPTDKITGVQLRVTGPTGSGYSSTNAMSCTPTFTLCQLAVDTTQLSDGQYTLFANATNTAGKMINSSLTVAMDNTLPLLAIDSPASVAVTGTIYPKVVVTDENGVAEGSVSFSLSSYSYIMTCSIHAAGKKYVCGGNFDTRVITDEYYKLMFYASDVAGNANSASMTLLVDNVFGVGPSPDELTTTTTTAPASASTTTTQAQQGQPATSTTAPAPASVWQSWVENADNPVSVLVWNAQKAFDSTFNTWPLKAFAISMIVFLIILAVFRTSQVRRLFEKKKETIELE